MKSDETSLNIAPCISETIKLTREGNRNHLLSKAAWLIKQENKSAIESDPALIFKTLKELNEYFDKPLKQGEVEQIGVSAVQKDYHAGCKIFKKSCKGFRNCVYPYSEHPKIGSRKQTGLERLGIVLHENRSKAEDIAWELTNFNHIIRDKKTHELCIYNQESGYYKPYDESEFASFLAQQLDIRTLSENTVKETFKSFRFTASSNQDWISFENYIVNTNDLNFLEYNQHYFIRTHIPFNYRKDLEEIHENTFVEKTLREILSNSDDFDTYIEMLGYILANQGNPKQVLFLFHGPGNSGKSTLLKLVGKIFESTCSYVSLEDIANNHANVSAIIGKKVNIASDISDKAINDTSSLKRAVGGDGLTINKKYSQPVLLEPNEVPVTLASCNQVPRMGKDETDSAMMRRIILIKAPNNFEGIANPHLLSELWEDTAGMEWLLKKALQSNLIHEGDGASSFSTYRKSEEMKEIYKNLSNPMATVIETLFESTNIHELYIPSIMVTEIIKIYYSEHPELGKFKLKDIKIEMERFGVEQGRTTTEDNRNIRIYRFLRLKEGNEGYELKTTFESVTSLETSSTTK